MREPGLRGLWGPLCQAQEGDSRFPTQLFITSVSLKLGDSCPHLMG